MCSNSNLCMSVGASTAGANDIFWSISGIIVRFDLVAIEPRRLFCQLFIRFLTVGALNKLSSFLCRNVRSVDSGLLTKNRSDLVTVAVNFEFGM